MEMQLSEQSSVVKSPTSGSCKPCVASTFMLTGMLLQIIKGGLSLIGLNLYSYDLLRFNWSWLTYVLQIALVFFIAGLMHNRIATHIIGVGILFLTILAFEVNLAEQTIYAFAAAPGLGKKRKFNL